MKQIEQAYEGYKVINGLNKRFKEELGLPVLDVMILNEVAKHNDWVVKTDIDEKLGVLRSTSSKSIKQMRKNKQILKDRHIDNENIALLSMNDEMRENAKELFKKADAIYEDFMNPPKQEVSDEKQNSGQPNDVQKEHNKHQNQNSQEHNHKKHQK